MLRRSFLILFALFAALMVAAGPCYAKKGSGMVYEDPFDLGAGGASLTRASQAGMLIANPALLPYGDGFHRWVGSEATLIVGKDSTDFARSMSGGSEQDTGELLNTLTRTPVHAGITHSTSYMNKAFGLALFNRFEPDLFARKYGRTGLPEVSFSAESYHGVAISAASLVFSKVVSFGITGKYLYAAEPDLAIEINDEESLKKLTSSGGMQSMMTHNTGAGVDAGLIFFKQGLNLDWKLALKLDDAGGTKLSGGGALTSIPQTTSAGVATTLHTGTDALHLAVDYRDIQGAYREKLFKRVRAGAKIMIRRYVGVGMGVYDGWPSYAAELDLILIRLTAAAYTREMGDSPGVDSRPVYSAGLAMGF